MPITSPIRRNLNMDPSWVSFTSNDSLSTILTSGYLSLPEVQESIELYNNGDFQWLDNDFVMIQYDGGKGFFSYNASTNSFTSDLVNTNFLYNPLMTFSNPGNLSVSYIINLGEVNVLANKLCVMKMTMVFTPTFTTSTGGLLFTLPFNVSANIGGTLTDIQTTGITYPAGYTQLNPMALAGTSTMSLRLFGSGQLRTDVSTAQIVSGTLYNIHTGIHFFI